MIELLTWPVRTDGFVPRWECGLWSDGLGGLHILSDLVIWLAYLAIPIVLVLFVRRRRDLPFPRLFWLFGAFIIFCGTTHLLEAVIFYHPVYRLAGVVKLATASVSVATVVALVPAVPKALAMRTPSDLEAEVGKRTAELAAANAALRREVADRLRAEAELADRNEWFRVVLASTGDAVVATDPGRRVVFINPAAEALTGWAAADAVGRPIDEVVHTIDETTREWVESPVAKVLRDGRAVGLANHTLLVNRAGAKRIIDRSAAPIRDAGGRVLGVVMAMRDATAERVAADRLRASEVRFRQLADAMPQIVWTAAPDGQLTYLNRRWREYTGLDTAGGEASERVFHPADLGPMRAAWAPALAAAVPFEYEYRLRHADGGPYRWFLARCVPAVAADGRADGWYGTSTDIDDMKRSEEALRWERDRFARIVETVPGAVHSYRVGPDGAARFPYASPAIDGIYGFGPEELAADAAPVAPLHHPDDVPGLLAAVAESARTLAPWKATFRVRHPRKGEIWVEGHSMPVRDPDGGTTWHGILTDITDRHRAAEALAAEREFLGAVLENTSEGVIACGPDGRLTLSNRAARLIHGSPDAPLPPDCFRTHPRFRPDGVTPLGYDDLPLIRALGGERVRNVEFVIRTPAGKRALVGNGQPLYGAGGRKLGAVLAIHDLTDRRRLEEQLRQAAKMEAVGRLAGGIAHDFNNLLTVINGYAEVLTAGLAPADPAREFVGEITRAGNRAADLTRQLLAFSRQSVLQPRLLDPNKLVGELERMLRRLIGEDVELVTRYGAGVGRVTADPGQLEQAVVNLVVNARDAMPTGGTLTIETAEVELPAGDPGEPAEAAAGWYVRLAVTDTGTGIPADVLARIFDPFFTTKGVGKGTGLGLPMVYGAVRQAGGHVGVDSTVGAGTTFRLYLPRAAAGGSADRRPGSVAAAVPRGGETVLLVEDEAPVRELLRRVLEGGGYTLLEAADGAEAVRLAAALPGRLDLLVADVVMPGEGGPAVAARVLAARPGVKVLYLSGYTDDAVIRHGLTADAVHFLQKPFSPAALARKVRDVLNG